MFNLFGKSEKKENYPSIVEEIHNEFYTAGNRILAEADTIIEGCLSSYNEKGERLSLMGFNKTKEALQDNEAKATKAKAEEDVFLVGYFRTHYPQYKFITEDQVKAICEKYGLVCGDTSMYKGFVPELKLRQMEQFKLREVDKGLSLSNGIFLQGAEVREGSLKGYFHVFKKNEPRDSRDYAWQSENGVDFYARDKMDIFKVGRDIGGFSIPQTRYKICAPLKDMEIPSGKMINGYKIENIPDPIVLHPVKGGYLIVCAWGDEASDENVVNEKMN